MLILFDKPQWSLSNRTASFLAFSLIIEGTIEKVLQFKCHLSQFTIKSLVSLNKKKYFEHYRVVQTLKKLLTLLLSWFFSDDLFRAAYLYSYVTIKQRCAVPLEMLWFFLLNKSCNTYLEPMLPPGNRNWQLIYFYINESFSVLFHQIAVAIDNKL